MVEEKKKSELSGRGNLTDRFRSTNNDSDSFSDVQSVKSASTSTFRDTEIEEDMATSLMKM